MAFQHEQFAAHIWENYGLASRVGDCELSCGGGLALGVTALVGFSVSIVRLVATVASPARRNRLSV